MQLPSIHRLSGRFQDRAQERAFVQANWSGIQLQSALTLIGFSLAWLISLATDVTYLSNSDWFLPVAGSRILSGVFGLVAGVWLLRVRLEPGAALAAILVNAWALLSIVTAATVASIYPLVEADAEGISGVLVFTSFWMSIQVLGLGIALAHWSRAIIATALAYLAIYTSLALYWSPRLPEPMLGTGILVLTACVFAVILSALFSYRARHRHYLTRLYEAAKQEAEKAQEFAAFLLAATGHDIRQPVYALDLNAAMLEEQIEKRDWENAQKLSRKQRDVLRNVSRMLSSVLELSYLDRDRGRVEGEDVATATLFNSLRSAFQDIAASRNIRFKIVESSATVRVDPGIIEHILTNLVANAIYHSGGDRILVGARAGAEQIEILVADNGKGLGPEPLHMTGQSLQKLVQDPSRRHSGLGLEIIFRLAEKGGVALSLDSQPGRGVVARLICPRAGHSG